MQLNEAFYNTEDKNVNFKKYQFRFGAYWIKINSEEKNRDWNLKNSFQTICI